MMSGSDHVQAPAGGTIKNAELSGVDCNPSGVEHAPTSAELPWPAMQAVMASLELEASLCEIIECLFRQHDFNGLRQVLLSALPEGDALSERSIEAARNAALLIPPPVRAICTAKRISARLESALSPSDLSVLAHALVEERDACDWERLDAMRRAFMDPETDLLVSQWQCFDPDSVLRHSHAAEVL